MSQTKDLPQTDGEAWQLLLGKNPTPEAHTFLTFYYFRRGQGMSISDAYNATMRAWADFLLLPKVPTGLGSGGNHGEQCPP